MLRVWVTPSSFFLKMIPKSSFLSIRKRCW